MEKVGRYTVEELWDDGGVMITKGPHDTADFFILEFEQLEALYEAAKAERAKPKSKWRVWASS